MGILLSRIGVPKMQALLETLIAIDQVTKRNGFLESA